MKLQTRDVARQGHTHDFPTIRPRGCRLHQQNLGGNVKPNKVSRDFQMPLSSAFIFEDFKRVAQHFKSPKSRFNMKPIIISIFLIDSVTNSIHFPPQSNFFQLKSIFRQMVLQYYHFYLAKVILSQKFPVRCKRITAHSGKWKLLLTVCTTTNNITPIQTHTTILFGKHATDETGEWNIQLTKITSKILSHLTPIWDSFAILKGFR